eukprot:NODE_286_length_11757_cov_0.187768.p7 type:complete len:262 gc:universal NODE_286_length_11757_cov_0.187768:11567-10782(-)
MLSQDLLKLYRINRLSDLGQNFIFNKVLCKKLIKSLPDLSDKRLIEVGPGIGIFTSCLKDLNPKELVLYEKDVRLKPVLTNYNVIWGDYLKLKKASSHLPTWIVGNLPFNVSTRILVQCLNDMHNNSGLNPEGLLFMFQKEVALRICARQGSRNRGRLSFLSQIFSDVEYIQKVDKSVFSPIPKVDGAMVKFTRKLTCKDIDFNKMEVFLRELSKSPRKSIKLDPFYSKRLHELRTEDVIELYHKNVYLKKQEDQQYIIKQ